MKTAAGAALLAFLAVCALADSRRDLADVREDRRKLRRVAERTSPAGGGEITPARKVQAEIEALSEAMTPLMEKLVELQAAYERAEDLAPLEARRASAREPLEQLRVRRGALFRDFNAERQQEHLLQLRSLLTGGQDMDAKLASAMELEEFYKVAKAFDDRAGRMLLEEDGAWKAAQMRIEKKRRLRAWALGGAAALALFFAAGFWGLRRFKRAVTVSLLAERASAPALSAPALLSGPVWAPALERGVGASQPALSGPVEAKGEARLSPGAVIGGNYRVERELGRGGMGLVLEASDLTLQRMVAIKRMRAESGRDAAEAERFLVEARLVAALKHPNIVEIHTMFREAGELYLVFERVPGKTLAEHLASGRAIAPNSALSVLRQTAAALDYAHGLKVIHRDLKPANIMVTPQGVAKVMDFGLARQAGAAASPATRADSWGTTPYMAPEQELGEVSRESDIFALGVCAYEMLTGKLPFQGPNFLAQKRERRCVPLAQAAPHAPAGWGAVLARALEPEAAKRFHSAGEFAAALNPT